MVEEGESKVEAISAMFMGVVSFGGLVDCVLAIILRSFSVVADCDMRLNL